MADIALRSTTGDVATDALLRDAVARCAGAFPGRLLGSYLFGSYADGSAVPASDLDIILIFQGDDPDPGEARRARELAADWSRDHGLHLDLLPLGEDRLRREGHFRVKHGSVPLHGEDIRAALPDLSLAAYLRGYTRAPFGYASAGFRHTDRLVYPLAYPDPDDEFCGYVLANHEPVKALVAAACWDASLLVSLETGQLVPSKGASVRLYRARIGGAWADYLETLSTHGKGRWNYQVPAEPTGRALLRDLCRAYLRFENHYFARYRSYLLGELAAGEREGVIVAAQRLGEIAYPDDEVAAGLARAAAGDDRAVRDAARVALERLREGRR